MSSTTHLTSNLFGPMGVQACDYFFYLSVLGLVGLVVSMLGGVVSMVSAKKINGAVMASMLSSMFSAVVIYFSNRIFYNMCLSAR